ncbi:MAG: hypothetical protein MHM6MM_003077 [Cercozoa sp. M6MM]
MPRLRTGLLLTHLAISCISVVHGGVARKYMDSSNSEFDAEPTAGMSAAWSALVLTNLCAFLLTGIIWLSIVSKRSLREHPDFIVIGSYSFGEFLLELGCGLQCLFNVAAQRFFGRSTACLVEALFHAWAMISLQMLLVLVVLHTQRKLKTYSLTPWSAKLARGLCLFVFGFSALVLCVLVFAVPTGSSGSTKIWLMDSGVYCFVSFASLTSRVILVPITVISVVAIIVLYIDIDRRARASHEISGGVASQVSHTNAVDRSNSAHHLEHTHAHHEPWWKTIFHRTHDDAVGYRDSHNNCTRTDEVQRDQAGSATQRNDSLATQQSHVSSLRRRLRHRLARTLSRSRIRMSVVVAVFMICFLPLVGAFLWSSFTGERPSGPVDVWFGLSLHLHGSLSSIFMLMWHPQLRKAAVDLLPKCSAFRRDTPVIQPSKSKRTGFRNRSASITLATFSRVSTFS